VGIRKQGVDSPEGKKKIAMFFDIITDSRLISRLFQVVVVKEWKSRVVVRYNGWGEEQEEELDFQQIRPLVKKRKKKVNKRTRSRRKKKKLRDQLDDHENNAVNRVDASTL
jgi:hypothetical protein